MENIRKYTYTEGKKCSKSAKNWPQNQKLPKNGK